MPTLEIRDVPSESREDFNICLQKDENGFVNVYLVPVGCPLKTALHIVAGFNSEDKLIYTYGSDAEKLGWKFKHF